MELFEPNPRLVAQKAPLLPVQFVDYFRRLIDGVEPMCGWNDWWDVNAGELERIVGRTFFLRIKLDTVQTLADIVAARAVRRVPAPVYLPISPEEYAVISAVLEYVSRNESPSSIVTLEARTNGVGFSRPVVDRLRGLESEMELAPGVVNDLYLRNFARYQLIESGIRIRRPLRLTESEGSIGPEGAPWRLGVSRVSFDASGGRALACWHYHGRASAESVAIVLQSESPISAGSVEGWTVVGEWEVMAMNWTLRRD
jgi:hypothetical protein